MKNNKNVILCSKNNNDFDFDLLMIYDIQK